MERKRLETSNFSMEVPAQWRIASQTPAQTIIVDAHETVQLTLALLPVGTPAGAANRTRNAEYFDAGDTISLAQQRAAQRTLEGYIAQRGPSAAARQSQLFWKQVASYATCSVELIERPPQKSWWHKFMSPAIANLWRFWAILRHDTLLIVSCHGRHEAMECQRAALEQAVNSICLTPSRVAGKTFADAVLQLIRGEFPATPVAVIDNNTIRVGGQPVNLGSLHRRYLEQPAHLPEDVRSFFGRLLRRPRDPLAAYPACRTHILPEFYTSGPSTLAGQSVVRQEWVNGLYIGYTLHQRASVTTEHLRRWGIDEDALHAQAVENLIACTQDLTMEGNRFDGYTMLAFTQIDPRNAARVLLPDFHRRLREHLGTTFYAAIPSHECLLAFSTENAEALAWVRAQISGSYRRLTLPLSEKLFLVTPDGIAGDAGEDWDL